MEERVHPIPFRTRKLSSPSPMILHNVMWESRPLSTIAPKPLAATSARGFVFYPPLAPSFRPSPVLPTPPLALWSFSSLSPGCVQSPSAAFTQNRPLPATFFFFFFPLLHSLPLPETLEPPCLQFCLSLSGAFTQTRLLRPECVSAEILMLTYLSTLRSKSRRFLFRPQNAYFANSSNTSTSPPLTLRRV